MLRFKPAVDISAIPRELWFPLGAAALMRYRMGLHDTTVLSGPPFIGPGVTRLPIPPTVRLRVADLAGFDRGVLTGALREVLSPMGFTVYMNDEGLFITFSPAEPDVMVSMDLESSTT